MKTVRIKKDNLIAVLLEVILKINELKKEDSSFSRTPLGYGAGHPFKPKKKKMILGKSDYNLDAEGEEQNYVLKPVDISRVYKKGDKK